MPASPEPTVLQTAAQAQLRRQGAMDLTALAARLLAEGFDLGGDPEAFLDDELVERDDLDELPDGRQLDLVTTVEGAVATTRLTAEEITTGLVQVEPELELLADAFDEQSADGEPIETRQLLLGVLVDRPHMLREPRPPLTDLLDAAGLETDGDWVGEQGTDWGPDDEAWAYGLGADGREALGIVLAWNPMIPTSNAPSASPHPGPMAAGRNEACPCGSGRKCKVCCAEFEDAAAGTPAGMGTFDVARLRRLLGLS